MTDRDHTITGQAFRQFQYPTLPLKVGSDYLQAALARALQPAWLSGEATAPTGPQ
jgi:hypothetical protein